MKKSILVIWFCFLGAAVFAQEEWRVKAFVGNSNAALWEKAGYVGGGEYEVSDFYEVGLRIGKKWNSKWGMESGLSYSFAQVFYWTGAPGTNPFPGNGVGYSGEFTDFRMLSSPILISYQLFNFLAIQSGPMLSFQLSDFPRRKQSGLGYLVGFNLSHDFNKVGLFLQPNFKRHAAIPFEQNSRRLTEFGVQFGVSYLLVK